MIRATSPQDTPQLIALAKGTSVFKPLEIQALREVLDDYHKSMREQGHRSITYEHEGQIAGFAYYAPSAMSERGWYLYWIAVSKEIQAHGIGGKMMRHVEDDIRKSNGRILLIETSSMPHYEPTRRFYLKHGYEELAVLRDFYADGDSMVVYSKRMD